MYSWHEIDSGGSLRHALSAMPFDYQPARVARELEDGLNAVAARLLIEYQYNDKDYRSTYYHFYAKKGYSYSRHCIRLHFFKSTASYSEATRVLSSSDGDIEDAYLGYIVVRPTRLFTLGRSVLSPQMRLNARGHITASKHKVHVLGYTLSVEGFPWMNQHSDISVCAHAACWGILRHYSERYSKYAEVLLHDVTRLAQPFDPGGQNPSNGLYLSEAERIFQAAGTFPVVLARGEGADQESDKSFFRQLFCYLESGFPVFAAMQARHHAVAVVGVDWDNCTPNLPKPGEGLADAWDKASGLVAVDDNQLPYIFIPKSNVPSSGNVEHPPTYTTADIDGFIVPLPEKVFYPAAAVDKLAREWFDFPQTLLSMPEKEGAVIRYFVTTSAAYKRFLRENMGFFEPRLYGALHDLPLPQFVWVLEFASTHDWAKKRVTACAVIDGTASLHDNLPIFAAMDARKATLHERDSPGSDVLQFDLGDDRQWVYPRMVSNLYPVETTLTSVARLSSNDGAVSLEQKHADK